MKWLWGLLKKYKLFAILIIAILAIIPLIFDVLFLLGQGMKHPILTNYDSKSLLDYFGNSLGFLGTLFLGLITLNFTREFSQNSNEMQKNTLEYSAYTSMCLKGIGIRTEDGLHDFRVLFHANNEFILSIYVESMSISWGDIDDVTKQDSVLITSKNLYQVRAGHDDKEAKYHMIDIPIAKQYEDRIDEIKAEEKIRIDIELTINNCFGIKTEYKGTAVLKRHEKLSNIYLCDVSFLNIQHIHRERIGNCVNLCCQIK